MKTENADDVNKELEADKISIWNDGGGFWTVRVKDETVGEFTNEEAAIKAARQTAKDINP